MSDFDLHKKISELKGAIYQWAVTRDLWDDVEFSTYLHIFGCVPDTTYVLLLRYEGPLYSLFNEHQSEEYLDEFYSILNEYGFWYELIDHVTLGIYPNGEDMASEYRQMLQWEFLCELVKPDFLDVYLEIYQYLAAYPDRLKEIDPRNFEHFLDAIFRNNGIQSVVGPGSGDGGVDLRLYQNDVVGEIVTLVQAKRYAAHNPVGLEAVQALSAAVEDERANRGMLVTTSRFLPGAADFAARQNTRISLKTSEDIVVWANSASERIAKKVLEACLKPNIEKLLQNPSSGSVGKVFHSRWGYNMVHNEFAVCVLESPGAGILLPLQNIKASGNKDSFRGYELPHITASGLNALNPQKAFRAKKGLDGRLCFSANSNTYWEWDKAPAHFDYLD